MSKPPPTADRSYAKVAGLYDWLAKGQARRLPAWKSDQIDRLNAGDRALYVGAGPGWDALAAAQAGCDVTCMDLARPMLDRLRQRFDAAGVRGQFIEADVANHQPDQPYDAIVANFFFNIFAPDTALELMRTCRRLLRPHGVLMVADFIQPQGRAIGRVIQSANYRAAIGLYAMFGCARWQPMHDYAAMASDAGLHVLEYLRYRKARWLPPTYAMMVLARDD